MSWACDLWESGLGKYYKNTLEAVMGLGTGVQIKKVDMEAMADQIGSAANLSANNAQALKSLMGGTRHAPSKDERVILAEISKREENKVIEILREKPELTRARNENNEPLTLCLLTEGMFKAFYAVIELDPELLAEDSVQRPVIVDAASHDKTGALMRFLIGKGADIDAQDVMGWSALLIAMQRQNWAAVEILLSKGARTDQANAMGMTARSMAQGEHDNLDEFSNTLPAGIDKRQLMEMLQNSGVLCTSSSIPPGLRKAIIDHQR
jgi:hypothetical protein